MTLRPAQGILQQILARRVGMYLFTDCYSLFSTITKYQSLREKRLLIDLAVLRQAYRHHKVDDVGFIRSLHNLADCVTKYVKNSALLDVLHTGNLSHPVEEYIKCDKVGAKDEESNAEVDMSIFYGTAWR
jgi:hypothetical protein